MDMEMMRHVCDGATGCGHIQCDRCFPMTGGGGEAEMENPQCEDVTMSDDERYICENCGHDADWSMKKCAGCRDVYYCSESCHTEHWQSEHRDTCTRRYNVERRKKFKTPCGQTYWYDSDYWLYTSKEAQMPIGYWSLRDQSVYLEPGSSDEEDDSDSEDEEMPPPLYEDAMSIDDGDNEIDGEHIMI